jgi:hypothetical protein
MLLLLVASTFDIHVFNIGPTQDLYKESPVLTLDIVSMFVTCNRMMLVPTWFLSK